jgi:hypothetical protein
MLRWAIGDDMFFSGLKDLADKFAFRPVSTEDFQQVISRDGTQNSPTSAVWSRKR